jgi:hypothetical protein
MILLFKDVLLIVSFPFSFLSTIYPPPLLCKPFSPPFFFYIPSSIMIIKSLHCMVKRWGPSAASQLVEQNKERNVSFFFTYIYSFLSFFFSRQLFSDQQQLFFASSAIHKREMRVPSHSLSLLLLLLSRLAEQANNFF